MTKKPISLAELKQLAQGTLLDIPGFEDGQTITVRVKRVDVTAELASNDQLPTILQNTVIKEFEKGASEQSIQKKVENELQGDLSSLSQIAPMIDTMVRKALVEPTFEDFEKNYPLTMAQKMHIFGWLTEEVKSFRPSNNKSSKNKQHPNNRKNMGNKTQRTVHRNK